MPWRPGPEHCGDIMQLHQQTATSTTTDGILYHYHSNGNIMSHVFYLCNCVRFYVYNIMIRSVAVDCLFLVMHINSLSIRIDASFHLDSLVTVHSALLFTQAF